MAYMHDFFSAISGLTPTTSFTLADHVKEAAKKISGNTANNVINVLDYAKGDGTTDDTAAINSALTAASGKILSFAKGGTFKVTGTLNVPTNTSIIGNGATIDASSMAAGSSGVQKLVMASRGTLNTAQAISVALVKATRVVSGIASTTGLAAGDLILINNEESPVPGMVRTDRDKGELAIIQSVDSGTQVTLTSGLLYDYGNTSLQLRKLNPVENVSISDLKFKCGGVGSGHDAIEIYAGRNINIQNVLVDGAEDIAINLRMVYTGKVLYCDLRNSTDPSYTTTGYLVCVVEGSQDVLIHGNEFYFSRHWVTGGGAYPAAHVTVSKNRGNRSIAAGFDTHESCIYWNFEGNIAHGVAGGFGMRGQYVTLSNNEVWDCTGNAYEAKTFDLVSEQRGIRFINNLAVRCAAAVVVDGAAHAPDPECAKIDCEVIGNTAIDCGGTTADAFILRVFDGLVVSDNNIVRAGRNGMLILGTATYTSKNLLLGDNKITTPGQHGVEVQLVDDIAYGGGIVTTPVKNGYQFTTCNRTVGTAPKVTAPGNHGIFINGGTIHSIANPQISGGLNGSFDAVRVSASSKLQIVGGYLASARYALFSSTTDRVSLVGTDVSDAVNASKNSIDATVKLISLQV